jgi:hypothetical protein
MPLDSMTTQWVSATHAAQLADEYFAVPMVDVSSSNVGRIGYDNDTARLYVQFRNKSERSRNGATYVYRDVPNAVFEALMQADEDADGSVGSTFHRLVKTAGFKYTRI